jgi:hypothetical protein
MNARLIIVLISSSLAACAALRDRDGDGDPVDYQPRIRPANFQSQVDNPWWPLVPGTVFRYVESKGEERNDGVVIVTAERKTIMGVECVVVHDQVSHQGRVLEDTNDWYAQDRQGNVWYFGEDSRAFDDKGHVSTEGSWEAGVNGAQPGIVMPAQPTPGPAYRQEYLKGHAEDMGQILATNDTVSVPFGQFSAALQTKEWSELEAGSDRKWYARGIGFVRAQAEDGEITELVAMSKVP